MSLVEKLMGRRQFLIASGLASGCALTCKKLAGFQTDVVMAADRAATASVKASGNRCPNLLSPLRIRNVMLKNRIMHTVAPPYLLQGPENFPTDAYRNHYSNMAKNAAIVSISTHYGPYPRTWDDKTDYSKMGYHFSNNTWQNSPTVYNYVQRMIEDIHCEGSLVLFAGDTGKVTGLGPTWGPGPEGAHLYNSVAEAQAAQAAADGTQGKASTGTGAAPGGAGGPGGGGGAPAGSGPQGQQAPGGGGAAPGGNAGGSGRQGQASVNIQEIIAQAKEAENKGYDVYRLNTSSVEAAQAVRSSTNLIIMSSLRVGSGGGGMGGNKKNAPGVSNVNQPTAAEIEQAVESARKFEGLVDFVWIRDGRHEHPNSFIQDKDRPFNLAYSEAIKKAGIKIITCPSAGFHDPIMNDRFIADGLMDMVGMTTPFFADPEFVKKISEGMADDIIPCVQCQNCHGISKTSGPYYQSCTVNPKWAAPVYKLHSITAPKTKKKVAVIGGGPAGMKAALTAAERGHKVTLYEKDAALGGLIKFSDYSQWRWNHKDFKDYLINQVKKAGIDVKLNTTATPEMIKSAGFDAVLVATGAEPVVSRMKSDGSKVLNILEVYSKKTELGKNVVLIGAGKFGTEAAIGIAKDGHKVTVLTSGKEMIEPENIGPHNASNQEDIYQNHPNFSYVLEAMVKSITGGKVTYTDSKGIETSIPADSIVIYSGLKPRMDEAEKFIGSANQVLPLGDCTGKNGNLQKAVRSAFFVASQV